LSKRDNLGVGVRLADLDESVDSLVVERSVRTMPRVKVA
jgi:hypothetical protein